MLKGILAFAILVTVCVRCHASPAESTVMVAGFNYQVVMKGTGSGFCIRPGEVITAKHVADIGTSLRVQDSNGTWHNAVCVRVGKPDWAVLSVPTLRCSVLAADTDGTVEGESIAAYGRFKDGMRCGGLGVVRDWIPWQGRFQHCTTQVYPGFSGGPVLDSAGLVVGLVSQQTPGGSCLYVPIGCVVGR